MKNWCVIVLRSKYLPQRQTQSSYLSFRLGDLEQIRDGHISPLEVHKFLPLSLTIEHETMTPKQNLPS